MSIATLRARCLSRAGAIAATATAATVLSFAPSLSEPAHATVLASTQSSTPHAAAHKSSSKSSFKAQREAKVRAVLRAARRQKGKPYRYGAAGPHAFDCSGFVRYVFLHSVHRSLPHNAAQQFHAIVHIHKSQLKPGDLVFTDNGGISHVGIYDGHWTWWNAPHTGTHVRREHIYHAHFVYGRVLRFKH